MRLTRKETQRQTRDKLLAAAHSSIVEEGVAAMSIRNICSAAGHSQGAFYSNFASKDDLLVEILQAHIQDEVVLLRGGTPRSLNGIAKERPPATICSENLWRI